jgi:hypothetical protein
MRRLKRKRSKAPECSSAAVVQNALLAEEKALASMALLEEGQLVGRGTQDLLVAVAMTKVPGGQMFRMMQANVKRVDV